MIRAFLGALCAVVTFSGSVAAQRPAAAAQPPAAAPQPAPADPAAADPTAAEPRLVFEREVYSYPGAGGRRDPFRPLTGAEEVGPTFADFKLRMILYLQSSPSRSVASVEDGAKKVHRVRRGDTIGNATVLDIGPERVVFSVEDFGLRRQEVLVLKPTNGKERTR